MGGVAHGVKEGHHVLRQVLVDEDHVAGRDAHVLSKSAVPVHAHALGVLAPLDVAGVAVAAVAAGDMALAADPAAHLQTLDASAQLGNLAHILMADDHGGPDVLHRPGVPVVDMYVRAADGGLVDFDEHLSGAGFGNGNLPQFQTNARSWLHQCVHELCHNCPPIKYIYMNRCIHCKDSIRQSAPNVNRKFRKFPEGSQRHGQMRT